MFFALIIVALALASIHAYRLETRTVEQVARIVLVYVLVLYCGVGMLAVSIAILVAPGWVATMLPVGPVTPVVTFFGWAYLGMSVPAVLTARYRGGFLAASAITWSIYFAGATLVHLHGGGGHGAGAGGVIMTFATHGLVTAVLVPALILAKPWRPASERRTRDQGPPEPPR